MMVDMVMVVGLTVVVVCAAAARLVQNFGFSSMIRSLWLVIDVSYLCRCRQMSNACTCSVLVLLAAAAARAAAAALLCLRVLCHGFLV